MNDEGRHQRIGGFRDLDKAKDGESQLDGSQDHRIDITNGLSKISLMGIIHSRQKKMVRAK